MGNGDVVGGVPVAAGGCATTWSRDTTAKTPTQSATEMDIASQRVRAVNFDIAAILRDARRSLNADVDEA